VLAFVGDDRRLAEPEFLDLLCEDLQALNQGGPGSFKPVLKSDDHRTSHQPHTFLLEEPRPTDSI
jgi:hypothetical protein